VERNYPALFAALDRLLNAGRDAALTEETLRRSFEEAAEGFGADTALLMMVEREEPLRMRAAAARGLSADEIAACQDGLPVPGVSVSRIREAVASGATILGDSGRIDDGIPGGALRGRATSMLCAAAVDPRSRAVVAVLYLRGGRPFREFDRAWIAVYAQALGRGLGRSR
jgi:hypothetical protein